jgi:ketosteroid isomerase-like protein
MTQIKQSQTDATQREGTACILRLQQAINQHDLEAMASCFAPDYDSIFPAHPNRAFRGQPRMRVNWTRIFNFVPDIHAELLRVVERGETVWAEWEWRGTQVDGNPHHQRGVTIQGVRDSRIVWARLYIEPVQSDGHVIGTTPERGTP